jgi:histidinol dehydrogenase
MKRLSSPQQSTWNELCKRPTLELEFLQSSVRNILNRVRQSGDQALKEFALRFDRAKLDSIQVTRDEIAKSVSTLDGSLRAAIDTAAENIRKFHGAQVRDFQPIETMPGVTCWRKSIPVERVGIYVPGGTAPLFSTVLMLAIPASIAGCKQVILCTPPNSDGHVAPAILYSAQLAGVSAIFKVGGAQAIGAMAYGTETIPAVHKIFGPGNQYVVAAKQAVSQEGIAIDLPAGPSEVLIVADYTANPSYVAADLLSQAEHGPDSQVVLVTTKDDLISLVETEIESQLDRLPRKDVAQQALSNSLAISFSDQEEALEFVNTYAPEHLILNCKDADRLASHVRDAGSVFLGQWSPESAGDYASGTNHTLPTNGYAKAYSGVSLESFQKIITFQKLTEDGLRTLGPSVMRMAEAEHLMGHKESIDIRLKDLAR